MDADQTPPPAPNAQHALRPESQVRCPECGYSLEGHADPSRCPECGADFSELPGGVRWFAAERLRLTAFAALLLGAALIVLSACRSEGVGGDMLDALDNEIRMISRLAGADVTAKISYLACFLGAVLLWSAAPKPRPAALNACLIGCLVTPVLSLACDLYIQRFAGGDFRRSGNALALGDQIVIASVAGAAAVAWTVTLILMLLLVAHHLRRFGLTPLADRLAPWARPLFFLLPTLVIIERVTSHMFGASARSGGGFGGSPMASVIGRDFDLLLLLLAPLHQGLSIILSLVIAYAAARLWLRTRWTLEAAWAPKR